MKLIKTLAFILLSFSGVTGTCQEKYDHKPYISFDFSKFGAGHPAIGYRASKDDFTYDISLGYDYKEKFLGDMNLLVISPNILYSFYKESPSEIYAGIGCDVEVYLKKFLDVKSKNFIFYPRISLGYSFLVNESHNIFFELYYHPVDFKDSEINSYHFTGLKMGVGF
jgi:hypothetical protein